MIDMKDGEVVVTASPQEWPPRDDDIVTFRGVPMRMMDALAKQQEEINAELQERFKLEWNPDAIHLEYPHGEPGAPVPCRFNLTIGQPMLWARIADIVRRAKRWWKELE